MKARERGECNRERKTVNADMPKRHESYEWKTKQNESEKRERENLGRESGGETMQGKQFSTTFVSTEIWVLRARDERAKGVHRRQRKRKDVVFQLI